MFWKIVFMRFEVKKQDAWIGAYWRQDRYILHIMGTLSSNGSTSYYRSVNTRRELVTRVPKPTKYPWKAAWIHLLSKQQEAIAYKHYSKNYKHEDSCVTACSLLNGNEIYWSSYRDGGYVQHRPIKKWLRTKKQIDDHIQTCDCSNKKDSNESLRSVSRRSNICHDVSNHRNEKDKFNTDKTYRFSRNLHSFNSLQQVPYRLFTIVRGEHLRGYMHTK